MSRCKRALTISLIAMSAVTFTSGCSNKKEPLTDTPTSLKRGSGPRLPETSRLSPNQSIENAIRMLINGERNFQQVINERDEQELGSFYDQLAYNMFNQNGPSAERINDILENMNSTQRTQLFARLSCFLVNRSFQERVQALLPDIKESDIQQELSEILETSRTSLF